MQSIISKDKQIKMLIDKNLKKVYEGVPGRSLDLQSRLLEQLQILQRTQAGEKKRGKS